jgi:hypothetical protein
VAELRDEIDRRVDALGPIPLWSEHPQPVSSEWVLTPTGLAIPHLLAHCPHLEASVLPPPLLAGIATMLGSGARVELAGAVVTDRARPFFPWHTHIDGEEEGVRNRAGVWPRIERLRRIFTLLYLHDVDDDGGPLRVLPRREGDPCEPVAAQTDLDWPGQVELRPRAGELVALDECTWHAARAMTRGGRRAFVGVYFAAADTPPAPWADPRLASRSLHA